MASLSLACAALHAALELCMLFAAQSAHVFFFRKALLNKSNAVLVVQASETVGFIPLDLVHYGAQFQLVGFTPQLF
jgi:hypothetical protein